MSAPGERGFLPPHLLERLGGLDLVARTVAEGFVAGSHRSFRAGAGEEFARHREYRPGDDPRAIDWRLYGRSDRLYVRETRAESTLRAYLVVDASLSMGYADETGTTKLRYACYLAAALGYLMLRQGDQVGLASYGAELRLHLPPSNRAGHLHELLRALEGLEPHGAASAAPALERVGETMARRGRVLLLSDLLEGDDGTALVQALGRLRARGDEVIVLRPLTPVELGEREGGAGAYFDPEHPAALVPVPSTTDPGYRVRLRAYYDGLARVMEERGVEYVPLSTVLPVERALGEWLNLR